jgi:hypothetical protein
MTHQPAAYLEKDRAALAKVRESSPRDGDRISTRLRGNRDCGR